MPTLRAAFHSSAVDVAVAIGVDPAEVLAQFLIGSEFLLRNAAVVILVVLLERGVEGSHPRLVGVQGRDEHGIGGGDRGARAAHGAERYPPARLADGELVAIETRGAEHDEMGRPLRGPVHDRGCEAYRRRGARGLPTLASGLDVDGEDVRSAHLIARAPAGLRR